MGGGAAPFANPNASGWNGAQAVFDQANMGMTGGYAPGMGMPGAGMPGMGGMGMPGYGFAPPRRNNSSKKAILWTSVGGGAVLVLFVIGLVVVRAVNSARAALAVAAASRQANLAANPPSSGNPPSAVPVTFPKPTFPSIAAPDTSAADQQANDALLEKFCGKLEEYANLLAGIQSGPALEANASRIQQLVNEINSMRLDVQNIDFRTTRTENNRLTAKYKTRLENASRRAKSEDDRILHASIQWQTQAILDRFKRPELGTPPGMSSTPGFSSPPGAPATPGMPTPGMPTPGVPTAPGVTYPPGIPSPPNIPRAGAPTPGGRLPRRPGR